MHSHLEFELGRARAAEIRGEVERDRLESRLTKAHRAEELGLPRRGMARGVAARAMAILTALFR